MPSVRHVDLATVPFHPVTVQILWVWYNYWFSSYGTFCAWSLWSL